MWKRLVILILFAIALTCVGCQQTTWNTKAYDLSGKLVYEGTIITPGWVTPDGKRISIGNATVIMEEAEKGQ